MRILGKEERNDRFSRNLIYHLVSLSNAHDVREVLDWLISENHALLEFSINYVYDHADLRPPRSFSTESELIDALKKEDFEWIDTIIICMTQNSKRVYASLYPNSDMVHVTYTHGK